MWQYALNLGCICSLGISLVVSAEARAAAPASPAPLFTLADALQAARTEDEQHQMVREQLEQVGLLRDRTWAALLPTLAARGTFSYADKEIGFNDRVIQRQDTFAGRVEAGLTVFRGPAIPDVVGAHQRYESAELRARWTVNDLDFEVARAYFAALAAENLVGAGERSLRTAQEHLDAVRARRAAGEALGVDEARAESEVVAARGARLRAGNALESGLDLLAFLTARERPFALERPGSFALNGSPEEPPTAELVAPRLDLQAALLDVDTAETAVTSAWMDYLPRLSLVWSFNASQNTGWSGDPYNWNLLAALDWQLFDGGLRRATRLERASRLRAARLQSQLLERAVELELRQARRDVQTARSTLTTAQERLILAQRTQSMVMTRYRAGLATSLEVVEADDSLRQAEVAMVAEELNLALRRLALLRARGQDPLARAVEENDAGLR